MPGEPSMFSHCGYQNNNSLGQSQNSQLALERSEFWPDSAARLTLILRAT